ncbi:MAG: M15 family metallopeptidase [Candidatus Neomarinimicrobiota bacterium]|nr:M15 family metallopeptidase [Candidatus Neomarinimicrobiota bacterium]
MTCWSFARNIILVLSSLALTELQSFNENLNTYITKDVIIKNDLVNIQELDPTIIVELKYSTTDNFMNMDVYGDLEICYLRKAPAQMLVEAHTSLKGSYPNLRLLVYDGLRPRSIQWKLWKTLVDVPEAERTQFVADPRSGSIHNFGAAVDLTLADSSGNPLDMGTKYDYFGELAFPTLEDSLLTIGQLTNKQISNRHILRKIMQDAGFSPITTEWWHFDAFPYQVTKSKYEIIE